MRSHAKTITVIITVTNTVIITVIPPGASSCFLARRFDGQRELAHDWSAGRHARRRLHARSCRHIRPASGSQDRPEDCLRFPYENKEMIATRPVRAGKPVLHGPLSGASPVHQDLCCPVGQPEVRDD
jgi:hypothetical protein